MDDSLTDLFGQVRESAETFSRQLQILRNQIAQAQQQTADVGQGRWTLNNLAAQWQMMTPESQRNLILLVGAVLYFTWK